MKDQLGFIHKTAEPQIMSRITDGVPWLFFPALEQVPDLKHGFSTRLGGCSEGYFSSMNLSFTRGDEDACVRENYRRMGRAIGFQPEDLVLTWQTHTNHIRVVTSEDRGKGYSRERDYRDVDGLVTDVPGLVLAAFSADCVPILLADPVRHACGAVHSGWKGTVSDAVGEAVRAMQNMYHSDPGDILAAIGPSICQDCYEVSEDVIEKFRERYPSELHESLFYRKENGKYQLSLWEACRQNLLMAGLLPEHVHVTDVCTRCNPDKLFSHRAQGERRGIMAAFITFDAS